MNLENAQSQICSDRIIFPSVITHRNTNFVCGKFKRRLIIFVANNIYTFDFEIGKKIINCSMLYFFILIYYVYFIFFYTLKTYYLEKYTIIKYLLNVGIVISLQTLRNSDTYNMRVDTYYKL